VVTTVVTKAAPHYLIADEPPLTVRPTRGGDAWQARNDGLAAPPAARSAASAEPLVLLGMPAIGRPGS
jgi:tRNA-2-methylthio-N6-dimethylallyladenosine synthase